MPTTSTPDTATPRVHQYGAVASVLSAHFHPHIEKPMPHWQCQCWPVAMAGASQNPRSMASTPAANAPGRADARRAAPARAIWIGIAVATMASASCGVNPPCPVAIRYTPPRRSGPAPPRGRRSDPVHRGPRSSSRLLGGGSPGVFVSARVPSGRTATHRRVGRRSPHTGLQHGVAALLAARSTARSIWGHCSSFLNVVGTTVITRRLAVSSP